MKIPFAGSKPVQGSRVPEGSRQAKGKPSRPRTAAQVRAAFDREQERQAKDMRRRWEAEEMIGEGREVEWTPPVTPVYTPAGWMSAPPVVAPMEVEIGAMGVQYVVAVLNDRMMDLWDAIYIVSGQRYSAGAKLSHRTLARLTAEIFCCSECKRWRATTSAGMSVTTLYPSIRCADCRRVAAGNARGGYFRDVSGMRKLTPGYAPERNSYGQAVDDVMSELVDDPIWGIDEDLVELRKQMVEIAKETGLIVKVGPELTKAMVKRRKEVNDRIRPDGAKDVKIKKVVKREARRVFGHNRGRECFCARCVEARDEAQRAREGQPAIG